MIKSKKSILAGHRLSVQELFFRSGGGMFPGGYGVVGLAVGSRVVVSFRSVPSGGMEKHLDLSHYIISSFPSLVPSSYYRGYRIYQQTP